MSSRVAKKPIPVPSGVDVKIEASQITVKGPKGELHFPIRAGVKVNFEDQTLTIQPGSDAQQAYAYAGTVRSILNNNVQGVTQGFEKKLVLVGVGYRAQAGQAGGRAKLGLTLGLSHPVEYVAPQGIVFETPTQTEIFISRV